MPQAACSDTIAVRLDVTVPVAADQEGGSK